MSETLGSIIDNTKGIVGKNRNGEHIRQYKECVGKNRNACWDL